MGTGCKIFGELFGSLQKSAIISEWSGQESKGKSHLLHMSDWKFDCYATPANINVLDAEKTLWPLLFYISGLLWVKQQNVSSGMSGPSLLPPLLPRWHQSAFLCVFLFCVCLIAVVESGAWEGRPPAAHPHYHHHHSINTWFQPQPL